MAHDYTRGIGTVTITAEQRNAIIKLLREDPYRGHVAAARTAGVTADSSAAIRHALKADDEIQQALADARADYLKAKKLGMDRLLTKLSDIVGNDESSSQLRAITTAMNLHGVSASEPQRIEVTGAEGGPIVSEDRSAKLDQLRTVLDAALGSRPPTGDVADA